jgi:hypothetical protein
MNTHYCKVGTVRPTKNTIDDSREIDKNAIEQKSEKMTTKNESSK